MQKYIILEYEAVNNSLALFQNLLSGFVFAITDHQAYSFGDSALYSILEIDPNKWIVELVTYLHCLTIQWMLEFLMRACAVTLKEDRTHRFELQEPISKCFEKRD